MQGPGRSARVILLGTNLVIETKRRRKEGRLANDDRDLPRSGSAAVFYLGIAIFVSTNAIS